MAAIASPDRAAGPLWRRLFAPTSLPRQLVRRPAGLIGLLVVAAVVVVAIFAPLLAPHSPDAVDVVNMFQGPSPGHLLGTDALGRDNFSRLLFGTRTALGIALPAVAVAFVVGLCLGLVAGYLGGGVDKVLIVLIDTGLAFPAVILALAMITLLGPSIGNIILLIAVAYTPYYARLARAQTLAAKQNQYVKAERALGAGTARLLAVHVLPNIIPPLLILIAMDIPGAIGVEAGLAFLGLGVQPPTPDWGVMLNDGFTNIATTPWGLVGPLIALFLVTTAFTLLGETIRDIADPRFAGVRRRRLRFREIGKL
jgi:peptide/nickel transport system permease protein